MAKEYERSNVQSAFAAPSRLGSRSFVGGAAIAAAVASLAFLVVVSTCWLRLSNVARLAADGIGVKPGAATIQLRDGSRVLASPVSRDLPRAQSIALDHGDDAAVVAETISIQPIDAPFIQRTAEWRVPGHGISLDALGEPKSGTTWLGRLVPQLALELCGSWNNLWCEMGGLAITERVPAPSYEFEMIKKTTSELIDDEVGKPGVGEKALFLHFKADQKHIIPGMDLHEPERRRPHAGCDNMGMFHHNGFYDLPPCGDNRNQTPTRDQLVSCLWSTSRRCVQYMTSVDPDVRRSFVIFRDPRDVVISEYRMRTEVFNKASTGRFSSLEEFVRHKFETLVSWIHQRWVWHSGDLMKPSSFLVYYEEAKGSPLPLIGMANFMGLECSYDQAFSVWKAHQATSPHGDYTTLGLAVGTIQYMNATMAKLLPPLLALRYGVTPTDL